jgi:hypothetical protein
VGVRAEAMKHNTKLREAAARTFSF